jgi:peptidyl-prolyl cis-trans isomerase B (cyclophilin B)
MNSVSRLCQGGDKLRPYSWLCALLTLAAPAAAAPGPAESPAAAAPAALEAVVTTDAGEFVIRLLPEIAPKQVAHFVKTARAGGYDHTSFHRIIPNGIIQGGDPNTKDPRRAALYGKGGLGLVKAEFSDRPFVRGSVGAARRPSSVDSAGSQFFICLSAQPSLKGQYTLFGEVVAGLDAIDRIGATPVEGDRPKTRVEVRRVAIREATLPRPETGGTQ